MALVVTWGPKYKRKEFMLWSGKLQSQTVEVQLGTMAFDSSYPTGGEAIPASGTGVGLADARVMKVNIRPSGVYYFLFDKTAGKIAAWTSGAEVANTTDLSALTAVEFEMVMHCS